MEKYTFKWFCDAVSGNVRIYVPDYYVNSMKEAYHNGFARLEDSKEFDLLRKSVLKRLDFYDPHMNQDIRIFFPEEITKEVDEEK